MKFFTLVMFLVFFLVNSAFANYPYRHMFIGNFLYFTDGYWQIIHQEAIIDADGIQFIHIGE
jgi:hypothetical protein